MWRGPGGASRQTVEGRGRPGGRRSYRVSSGRGREGTTEDEEWEEAMTTEMLLLSS